MPKEDDGMKQQIVIKTIFAKKPERPQFLLFDNGIFIRIIL